MHYVKLFNINGVDTKQVACIELQGAPNAATEGAVGVLGMDMTSPTHEVYRCVAVQGSIYTWELLSAGMSIISATITGEGGLTHSFPYENLKIPSNYLIKRGDLILDSEGYLYQVDSIGSDSCDATYCGTHIGGIASGDKDCTLVVNGGKLQLVTESGKVLGEVDFLASDDETIHRDPSNGRACVMGVRTVNDTILHLFVGSQAEYDALPEQDKEDLFAIITDDTTEADLRRDINAIRTDISNGSLVPAKATVLTGSSGVFGILSGNPKDVTNILKNGSTYVFDVELEADGKSRGYRNFVLRIPSEFDDTSVYSTATFGYGDLFMMYISVTSMLGEKTLTLDGKTLSGGSGIFGGYAIMRYREIDKEIME